MSKTLKRGYIALCVVCFLNFVYDNYFTTLIKNYAPGEDVGLKVKRDGEFFNITIQ